MARPTSPRRFPRMARVNEVVREALADEIERLNDPRLGLVTITGVDVSNDLRHATVYYSALDTKKGARKVVDAQAPERQEETRAALSAAAPHLRTELGRQVRMKYTPKLTFLEDPAIVQGARIEELLRGISHSSPDADVDVDADEEPQA
jgi:ribosome-binding factor A